MTTSLRVKWLLFLVVYLLLALTLFWLYGQWSARSQQQELRDNGISRYPEAREIRPFQLVDEQGAEFGREDLLGRWNLVFFGFTHCPDICPLSLRELDEFYRQALAEYGQAPQVIMVTVDPLRDDPARLGAYLESFHPDLRGLTGSQRDLSSLAEDLYVVSNGADAHSPSHSTTAGSGRGGLSDAQAEAVISHSGHISVIDPQGRLVAVLRLPHRDSQIGMAYETLAQP